MHCLPFFLQLISAGLPAPAQQPSRMKIIRARRTQARPPSQPQTSGRMPLLAALA